MSTAWPWRSLRSLAFFVDRQGTSYMGFSVLPKATQFFDMFARAGANAVEAALLVEQRFADPSAVKHSQVKALEHVGDTMTGEIITLLNTQYITPFDREDIYGLATATDDVVDHMDYASELLDVYRIAETTDFARQQCGLMVSAAGHLAAALGNLRGLAQADGHLLELKRYEDEGDRLVKEAIGSLFDDPNPDPLYVMRWKDVYDALEDAIDACETAAHHVGNIVVKNS